MRQRIRKQQYKYRSQREHNGYPGILPAHKNSVNPVLYILRPYHHRIDLTHIVQSYDYVHQYMNSGAGSAYHDPCKKIKQKDQKQHQQSPSHKSYIHGIVMTDKTGIQKYEKNQDCKSVHSQVE